MSAINSINAVEQNGAIVIESENPSDDKTPPRIFKLNVDCFEELFDWLSLADLRAFRQTCKRMKRVVDYYIEINYPLVFKRLPIRDYHMDYLRRADPNGFILLNHIDFLTSKLTAVQIEGIKNYLDKVECINIESSQIEGEFNEMFLKFCPNIKCLVISKFRSGKIIGSGNEWLSRQYPTLECIVLHSSNLNLESETFELQSFFERNPKIQTFSTTFEFLWVNRHWLLESNVRLNQLDIIGACNANLPMDGIWNLVKKLYEQDFYKRLHITASWIEDQEDINQIVSLNGLEKLSLKSICLEFTIPPIAGLKELNIYAYEYFGDLKVHNLMNLEQLYIAFASLNDILPFVSCCTRLKQIVVNHLEIGTYFKNGIINLVALNNERKKLRRARKISFYVNEKIFLTQKWTTTINFDLIELKRIQSCEREQLFW